MPATDRRPLFPETRTTGVYPRVAQVRARPGLSDCPASSSKQIHAPVSAAGLPGPPPLVHRLRAHPQRPGDLPGVGVLREHLRGPQPHLLPAAGGCLAQTAHSSFRRAERTVAQTEPPDLHRDQEPTATLSKPYITAHISPAGILRTAQNVTAGLRPSVPGVPLPGHRPPADPGSIRRAAFRDGRGGARAASSVSSRRRVCAAAAGLARPVAWRGEQRLLAAGGVGQCSGQFADVLPDLDCAGVPG